MHIDRLMQLVSPKVGLIRAVSPQARGADEPLPPYLYTATLSNFDFRAADGNERIAAGKGRTEQEAIASAIGEAAERYCAYQWDPSRTRLASWNDVRDAGINPDELVLYSERQYRSRGWRTVPWRVDQQVTWMEAKELPSGRTIVVPASMVYLVHPAPRAEDYFASSTSNGLSAGASLEAAVLGGLCELMERDALMICWMNRLPAIELDLENTEAVVGSICRHYACFDVEVRAFLLPSDLPAAVVLAMSLDSHPSRPAQVIGMGCHPDPQVALRKAIFELCQGKPSETKRFEDKPPGGRLNGYEDVKTLDDHSAFLTLRERRGEFAFLWKTGARARVTDLPNPSSGNVATDLDNCTNQLGTAGHRVAYVDLTLPDIASCGCFVVRTLAAGLQPVHFGFGQERLGGRRLFELPQRLGFENRLRTESDLNPCPHPLA
jgi:ribosomal protein S12 methylthiotransferase accessory factor